VEVNGSKNASLPIMAAALLAPRRSTLLGVPRLSDIAVFKELIDHLGCKVERLDDGA
jgi:UDP-N-acetylglucosamine 1-carboxyvinyltransferase